MRMPQEDMVCAVEPASSALERARAEAAEVRLRLLVEAGRLLGDPLDGEEAVGAVAQLAVEAFVDWCAVDFLDAHGALRRLTVRRAGPERGARDAVVEACTPERVRPSALTEVVRSGRALLVTGLGPRRVDAAEPLDGGGSLLVVPLRTRHQCVGALSLVRGPARAGFTEADRMLAEELAGRAGLALDTARLLRESRRALTAAQRQVARLRARGEVDRLLAEAGLDLPTVLEVIVHRVSEAVGDGCVLQLVNGEAGVLEPVLLHHPDPEARALLAGTVHARRQRLGEGLHGGVALRGEPVRLPDMDAERARALGTLPEYLPYLERYGAQSLVVVPLVARRRVFGSLGVVRDVAGGHGPHDEDEVRLLGGVAERAALAIADARTHAVAIEGMRQRDDFLSVAGHELEAPLSALRLQVQLLARMAREVTLPRDLAQRVARAERSSERLGSLVNALLDAGRITSGRLRLEREEVDLAALARDTVERMAEAFGRGGCEVRLAADAETTGRWDRARLEQVLGHLLSNAARHGRGRPVEVRVEPAARERVRLVVKDQGQGIAPGDRPRLFERFGRAGPEPRSQGLGLGLWISREIVDAHGGAIHVQSAPGEGATFTVELPRD
ncbi:ATP-binding protein [Melittangium boletus]|uniref:sensor histidine kinase n=1 Tax=Melittangium boletus TaxID=83453 RepID=UPI003DA54BE5